MLRERHYAPVISMVTVFCPDKNRAMIIYPKPVFPVPDKNRFKENKMHIEDNSRIM